LEQLSLTLSIVIVSFNTKEKLRKCLSCLDMDRHEVIVVDNASSDGSQDLVKTEFPKVNFIANDQNVGFGKANNQGIDLAKGDHILFLNSDAYAQPGSIEKLSEVFKDGKVIAAGGKLLNPDGSLQESVAGPLTLWNVFLEQWYLDGIARRFGKGYWRTKSLSMDASSEVDQVMGACLMMRASSNQRFDERFFLYCEDTELCARLHDLGKILYVPQAEFIHELGSSSQQNRWLAVARYNFGKELYFKIRSGKFAHFICWKKNREGAFLRLMAGVLLSATKAGRTKAKIFAKVLFATEKAVIPPEHKSQ
jgi:N-acetylglucosaminyl-diphospho-decaprenol L-rhamnosyltransferase